MRLVHVAVHEHQSDAAVMADSRDETQRRRGSVRQRGDSLQVRVFAGDDPVTGNPIYLTATIRGTDRAARKRADKKVTEFLSGRLSSVSVRTRSRS